MWLALSGRFRAKWSAEINNEWKRNLLKNRPDLSAEQLDRTSELMDQALPDACVTGYEDLIEGLALPDIDGRHVLATAIRCNASVIVTFNQKDFPCSALDPFGIEAQHLDEFVDNLFDLDRTSVIAAAQRQRKQLKMPPHGCRHVSPTCVASGASSIGQGIDRLPDHALKAVRQ